MDTITEIMEHVTKQVVEDEENFIVEIIKPWCEKETQMIISKDDLRAAVLMYYGKRPVSGLVWQIEKKAHSGQWSEAVVYGMEKAAKMVEEYFK